MKKACFLFICFCLLRVVANCQEVYTDSTFIAVDSVVERLPAPTALYPNIVGKSMMTPSAWGGYGTFVFASIGGTFPQVYSLSPDLIASAGIGTGNSMKAVSVIGTLDVNDVSKVDNYSINLTVSRTLSIGNSISAGAIHLFADPLKTDMSASYYVAYSHAVQTLPSEIYGCSKLNYTIGAGIGRFSKKSLYDEQSGKGSKGTILFGNVSYEIVTHVNFGIEWTGVNLCSSVSWRPAYNLPAVCIGVADLTKFSGDRTRLLLGISYAYLLPKRINR